MKFIIVTIRRESDKVPMKYPAAYSAEEMQGKRRGAAIRDGGIQRGGDSAEMLCRVPDDYADRLALDPDIRIISPPQVEIWLANNPNLAKQPIESVNDESRLIMIQTKIAAGMGLSQEDLDALDPDHPTRGITRKTHDIAGQFKDV